MREASLRYIVMAMSVTAVAMVLVTDISFRSIDYKVVTLVNRILGYPKADIAYPNEGQSIVAAYWLSEVEAVKIILGIAFFLSVLSFGLGVIARVKYGYGSLLGYGVSISLVTIFYVMYVYNYLPEA